jgi:hypothetical protein
VIVETLVSKLRRREAEPTLAASPAGGE